MADRPLHEVSVKIVLYSHDLDKVAVMRYLVAKKTYPYVYGLPGGHVEANESPDEAIRREVTEELGVALIDGFDRIDFFLRNEKGSAIILAYRAILPVGMTIQSPEPDEEVGVWMTEGEVENLEDIGTEYKRIILEHWPKVR